MELAKLRFAAFDGGVRTGRSMGQEIDAADFSAEERAAFHDRLRRETAQLKRWFDEDAFDRAKGRMIGLELEGWLIDADNQPAPKNDAFFAETDDPDIVAELSKFNFEVNAPPRQLAPGAFAATLADLEAVWAKCRRAAAAIGCRPAAIGVLPTITEDRLRLDWMSESNRYRALNRELFRLRDQRPLHICIEGEDRLDYRCNTVMLEAACTSLQSHLKVTQDEAARFWNASLLAAGPLVAATANSPFLFGRELWSETRIPAFEQATAVHGFRDAEGRNVRRVTFGSGYVRDSLMELFIENLSYPDLLPALSDSGAKLAHLRMQNGTIWRWVRPILGFEADGTPHLRLEHRVMAAGPSLIDMTANLALCHGLTLALGRAETPPERETPFEHARTSFYECARHGLDATVPWAGQEVAIRVLLLDHLLPKARRALSFAGLPEAEIGALFDAVLIPRIRTGRTGADWQRRWIARHGADFAALTGAYVAAQATGDPVHEWGL